MLIFNAANSCIFIHLQINFERTIMYKIAIIEDDAPTNDEFKRYVTNFWPNSEVDQFHEFNSAAAALTNTNYDLVISDIDLGPGTDEYGGIKIARALDALKIPLLIVSGSPQPELHRSIFRALDAWDYLQKPISEADFVTQLDRAMTFRQARLQTLSNIGNSVAIPSDSSLEMNIHSGTAVKWKGKKVHLSMTQIYLLQVLLAKPNAHVKFEELFKFISTGRNKENLRVFMGKIRTAFRDVDPDFDSIKTIPMVGYSWSV